MTPLQDFNAKHLLAAEGWLELGLHNEAFEELDQITPELRAHPDVLEMRVRIFHEAKRWEEAVEISRGLTRLDPDRFAGWWMLSYALHELKRTTEACNNLMSIRDKFGQHALLHYNLACYFAQLGRVPEAITELSATFDLAPAMKVDALGDSDLEPVWKGMGSKL